MDNNNQNQNEKNIPEMDAAQEEAVEIRQPEAPETETSEADAPEASVSETQAPEGEAPELGEPEPQEEKPKAQKRPAGGGLRGDRFKRGGMATLMSVVFIAIVVVVNILVSVLSDRFPSMNIDLTAQRLNSLSDQALEIAQGVEQDTKIYLIGDEDSYRQDRLYASPYGLKYSQVANLAEKLREANPKISVEFIDPDTNPKFISDHADDALSSGYVLVETEKRSKALGPGDMFNVQQSSTTATGYDVFSKVDAALAGALEMVNLDQVPVVAIATGHGEMLGSSALSSFQGLLEEENFDVREVNFLTEEIPEDTQVLMLPTPTTDYTEEELQKIRDYLDDETRKVDASLLVTCHPTQGAMPNLAGFLEEWGVKVEEGIVAETDESRMALSSQAYVLVDPNSEVLSDGSYGTLISAASCPITLLFDEGNGEVNTTALWTTADTAFVSTEDMTEADAAAAQTAAQTVAAISARYFQGDGDYVRRSVVVFGSSYAFTDSFMGTSAFGIRDYVGDLMKYVTATDGSAVTVLPSQVQTNTVDVTASYSTVNLLGLGVFTVGLPVLILAAGLVIFLKRRHL